MITFRHFCVIVDYKHEASKLTKMHIIFVSNIFLSWGYLKGNLENLEISKIVFFTANL